MKPILSLLSPAGPQARLTVLIFHRVLAAPDALFPDEVDARRFEQICSWVRQWLDVMPLADAVRRLRAGTLPARAAAITFDDGYRDNHDVALPILQRHGLCATFFVATGYTAGACMWNDVVIESLRKSLLPRLDLASAADGLPAVELGCPAQRRHAIDAVLRQLKYRPVPERDAAVARISRLAGVAEPAHVMMSAQQLVAMRRAGMQIGAHTVSHPILATLARADARAEIAQSKQFLEHLLGEPVPLFAYPNGKPAIDFNAESSDIVRELGFEAAVTTCPGAASHATDPFSIPRFTPWDTRRLRFGLRLATNLRKAVASPAAAGNAAASHVRGKPA